eukprot:1228151-Karenia_brevis.AAC.1
MHLQFALRCASVEDSMNVCKAICSFMRMRHKLRLQITSFCILPMNASTVAEEISDKTTDVIIECMTQRWFRYFGAPDMLIRDGEGPMNSDSAKSWATHWNVELVIRP